MASAPSIAIFIYADSLAPVVVSTAVGRRERARLDAWLLENPDLERLVATAWALADGDEAGRS